MRCLAKKPESRYRGHGRSRGGAVRGPDRRQDRAPRWDDLPLPGRFPTWRVARSAAARDAVADSRRRCRAGGAGCGRWSPARARSPQSGSGCSSPSAPSTTTATTSAGRCSGRGQGCRRQLDWVMPPPREPDAPTAFAKVLELEELGGPSEALADDRADELRTEFAGTLIRHADVLWDAGRPGPGRATTTLGATCSTSTTNGRVRARRGRRRVQLPNSSRARQRGDFNEAELRSWPWRPAPRPRRTPTPRRLARAARPRPPTRPSCRPRARWRSRPSTGDSEAGVAHRPRRGNRLHCRPSRRSPTSPRRRSATRRRPRRGRRRGGDRTIAAAAPDAHPRALLGNGGARPGEGPGARRPGPGAARSGRRGEATCCSTRRSASTARTRWR